MTKIKALCNLLIILGVLLPCTVFSQELNINLGKRVNLKSKILQEDRTILIHLPTNYYNTNKNYPVLYRLDGDTLIMLESILICNRLTYIEEKISEFIIITIENTNRARDMWPTNTEYYPKPNKAGAKSFQGYLKKEVIPFIENNYRVSKENIICGQSLSSVFVLYSLLTNPEIFDTYIAISGGFPACEDYFTTIYTNAFQNPERFIGKKLFITHGLKDPLDPNGKIHQQLLNFSSYLKEHLDNEILYKYKTYENEGHVPFYSLYDGLKYVYEEK